MTPHLHELDVAPAPTQVPAGRPPAPPLPSSWVCTATWTSRVPRCRPRGRTPPLTRAPSRTSSRRASRCVFCGINPGRVSAAAARPLRQPAQRLLAAPARRRLHAAALRPAGAVRAARARLRHHERGLPDDARLGRPAARRLRRGRGSSGRLVSVRPRAIAFVGKEAYRGLFGERPELGPQLRTLGPTGALRAAVDLAGERRRAVRRAAPTGFARCIEWLEPVDREAVRALVVDARRPRAARAVLRTRARPVMVGHARRRARAGRERRARAPARAARGDRPAGLRARPARLRARSHVFPWDEAALPPAERFYLVRVETHEPAPTIDLVAGGRRTGTAGGRSTSSSATLARARSRRPTSPRLRVPLDVLSS